MAINVKKRKICVNLWNLCALIRTRIRAIRAECGEETHSASPSTHRSPFNPGYPWSANLFFVILVNSFYSCENGRVSRFNSGDLAGKCAASNRQQKIALRAENNCSSLIMFGSGWIFCAFAQFSAGIGPAHFPAETTRLLSRGCLPFSPKIRYKISLDFSNYIIHDNSWSITW